MRTPILVVGVALSSLLAGTLSFLIASGRLGSARSAQLEAIGVYSDFLGRVRAERQQRPALDAKLRAVVDRTLGASPEVVDSALRSRLNRIGEELRLADLAVSTEPDKERVPTPARSEFTAAERSLRDQPDFVEVRGSISGEGTLDQALRLVHRIEVEPWIKRIDQVRLDPTHTGERVRVLVRMTTLFVEGAAGQPVGQASGEAIAGYGRYAALAQRNPFRLPPPAPPPVVQKPAPPPPSFPWNQWKLTARLDGPLGAEACLRNTATNATLTLAPGGRISEAEFVGFDGTAALFRLAEAQFRVDLGATMDQRVPIPH